MDTYFSFIDSVQKNTKMVLGGVFFVTLTLISLFAFEATPVTRFASQEALAWHCESMTASPASIERGESSTLTWAFVDDENIWVTIEGVSGKWDGITGSTIVSPTQTTTYKAIAHKAGTDKTYECSVTVSVTEPPKEEPRVPACPYVASENVTVVNFNGGKERNDATLLLSNNSNNYELTASQTLPAGTYTVKTASWDGYADRVNVTQPKEQWNVLVRGSSWEKGPVGPTTDIADYVVQDSKNNTFANAIVLTETGSTVAVVHAVAGDNSSPNSVVPVCVAFEKKSEDPAPSCSMYVSSTQVKEGDTVTLNWSSSNTSSAFIDQGIGATTLSGSKNMTIQSATTFTGTFKDSKGKEVTCSAGVSIKSSGGGGKCINCDDDDEEEDEEDEDDPEPTIVLGKTVTKTGSYITLDQVPYTGFEAGPMLTTFFWLMVFVLSVLIAYISTQYHPLERLKVAFSTAYAYGTEEEVHEAVEMKYVMSPVQNIPALSEIPTQSHGSNSSDAISIIEDMAHKENILLSPEALRLMYAEIRNTDSSPTQYLTGLFEIAKTEYPQEDGWILLSKERAEKLLGKSQNNTVLNVTAENHASSEVEAEPKAFRVEQRPISKKYMPMSSSPVTSASQASGTKPEAKSSTSSSSDETAVVFIDSLVNLEKKKVFDTLRDFASRGNDVGAVITAVVRKLDEVYRYRLEGGRTPDKEIAGKTATWSNGDFENVLGILVECIDYTYANNHIGTKVALTKAFEHFEKKA